VESSGDWLSVEGEIGVSLPDDFRDFIKVYGSGTIGEFLTVFNSFYMRFWLNVIGQSKQQLDALQNLVRHGECPFELFLAQSGLLPVAMTDNGDVINWANFR
jgi:hypothetical protein